MQGTTIDTINHEIRCDLWHSFLHRCQITITATGGDGADFLRQTLEGKLLGRFSTHFALELLTAIAYSKHRVGTEEAADTFTKASFRDSTCNHRASVNAVRIVIVAEEVNEVAVLRCSRIDARNLAFVNPFPTHTVLTPTSEILAFVSPRAPSKAFLLTAPAKNVHTSGALMALSLGNLHCPEASNALRIRGGPAGGNGGGGGLLLGLLAHGIAGNVRSGTPTT